MRVEEWLKKLPYKIKSEIIFRSNDKGTGIDFQVLYECDGLACENCSSDLCHLTSNINHAKRFDIDE